MHRFTCVYHTHYLAIARLVAARRADPSRSLPRTPARASVRCQGRSLFRPLGSPGGTGGSLSNQRGEQLHEATSCRSNAAQGERRHRTIGRCPSARPQGWPPSALPLSAIHGTPRRTVYSGCLLDHSLLRSLSTALVYSLPGPQARNVYSLRRERPKLDESSWSSAIKTDLSPHPAEPLTHHSPELRQEQSGAL